MILLDELLVFPAIREELRRLIDYEDRMAAKYPTLDTTWWNINEVPIEWSPVRKLILAGTVEKYGRKDYRLKDREAAREALERCDSMIGVVTENDHHTLNEEVELPEDLFSIVEGHDDVKKLFRLSLEAKEPVHILLVSPPGSGKSLLLMELERLGGRFIVAGTATKAGIRNILFEETPRYLIIDELDKVSDPADLSSLLTWMESGRITVTKSGLSGTKEGKGWVFAACNRTDKLPLEILDRFLVLHLESYSQEDFQHIVVNYLVRRMNVPVELAYYIGSRAGELDNSVRKAIRIARMAKDTETVDLIISTIVKHRPREMKKRNHGAQNDSQVVTAKSPFGQKYSLEE